MGEVRRESKPGIRDDYDHDNYDGGGGGGGGSSSSSSSNGLIIHTFAKNPLILWDTYAPLPGKGKGIGKVKFVPELFF
jgi:hypothetical protein